MKALSRSHLWLMRNEPALRPVIRRFGPCTIRPLTEGSPYELLVRSVIYQQISGKAAEAIFNRMISLFPGGKFPEAARLAEVDVAFLRQGGVSGPKAKAILDIAKHAREGLLPTLNEAHAMGESELIERLTAIHGVGIWTAQMFLMFRLARPDVFPATDYGVRKGYALVFKKRSLPSPKKLEKESARWSPHRTAAAWYFWRALEMQPKK